MLLRIQLVSSGAFFVLTKDRALTTQINTTLFNSQSDFLGSYSYPGTMPLEPNRALISNAHMVASDSSLRTQEVMVWIGPLPWKQCEMTFSIENDTINYTLFIDSTLIASALSRITLNEVPSAYAGVTWPAIDDHEVFSTPADLATYMAAANAAAPCAYPMVFPSWRNNNGFKVKYTDYNAVYYAGTFDPTTYDPYHPSVHDNIGVGIRPNVPSIAVAHWAFKVTAAGSVDFGNGLVAFAGDGDYAVFDGNKWYKTYNPYGYRVTGGSPDICYPQEPIVNRWQREADGSASFLMDPLGGPYCQSQSPFFFLVYVLKRIAYSFGFTIVGKVLEDDWFKRIIIFSRVTVNHDGFLYEYTHFMPKITLSNFFKEVRQRFGIMIDFDITRKIMVVESLQRLQSTNDVIDLRPYQTKSYREIAVVDTWYNIQEIAETDDAAWSSTFVFTPLEVGKTDNSFVQTDVPLESVVTKMLTENSALDPLLINRSSPMTSLISNWRVPEIDEPLSPDAFLFDINAVSAGAENDFKLRFLYWHGMVADTNGFTYPYASSDNLDVTGTKIAGTNLSIAPAVADFSPLRDYFNFKANSKPAEIGFLMPIDQFLKLAANKRILYREPYNFSTISAILDTHAADIVPSKTNVPAKITLYPVVQPNNAFQPDPVVVITPPYDNGLVYVRFVLSNFTEEMVTHPTPENNFYEDVTVYFFADSAGTVPKSVINLNVGMNTLMSYFPGSGGPTVTTNVITHTLCNGISQALLTHALNLQNLTDGSGDEYSWIYTLLASSLYTIIP